MFRIGVIINFFYMLTIIILKQDIIKYLPLLSILYGISTSTYYTPYNLFVMNKIDNEYRTEYTVKSKIVLSLVGILCPILLGSMITITNYENTAWIILIISCIQILLSFILSSEEETKLQNFNLKNTLLKIKGNKQINKLLIAEYFFKIGSSEGALEVLITILIFNSFKTDFNLGIITSVTTMLSILFVFMYGKIYKTKNDNNIITISSIIPIILVLMLTTYKSDINIIIFNICYVISTTILSLTREIRLYNISNSYIIDKNIQTEFFTIRECILNFGKITGYILLLLVGISTNQFVSNIIMITLTLAILITGLNLK